MSAASDDSSACGVDRPRVAVSSCLLGLPVRYDGGHRRVEFLSERLGARVEWVRVCPEVEIGLGTPRDPIDLHETDDPARPRMVQGDRDLTAPMRSYAARRIEELRAAPIDGYILKARSPSCGLRDVWLHRRDGRIERAGEGIFARVLRETWPDLPIFDETDLEDPRVAEARVEWIFAFHRFRRRGPGLAGLQAFHREHRLQLAARAPARAVRLDRLLSEGAGTNGEEIESLSAHYRAEFSAALSSLPSGGG